MGILTVQSSTLKEESSKKIYELVVQRDAKQNIYRVNFELDTTNNEWKVRMEGGLALNLAEVNKIKDILTSLA